MKSKKVQNWGPKMRKGLIYIFFFPSLGNQHIIPTELTHSTVLQDYKEAEDKGFIHNSTLLQGITSCADVKSSHV